MGEDVHPDFDDIVELNAFLDFVIMNHVHVYKEYLREYNE